MLRKMPSSVRLASVKSSKTKPISARRRKTFALNPALWIHGKTKNISIPAAVKAMGAVTIVPSKRRDTRLKRKTSKKKRARGIIAIHPIRRNYEVRRSFATSFGIAPVASVNKHKSGFEYRLYIYLSMVSRRTWANVAFQSATADRLDEGLVVALDLIGVSHGVVSNRLVKMIDAAQIARDHRCVTCFVVRPGERQTAERRICSSSHAASGIRRQVAIFISRSWRT